MLGNNVSEADTLADYHSIFLEIVRYSCYGVCVSDHTDDHTGRSDYRADTNCSTTAQRGALDWMTPFHDAIKPVVEKLYHSVKTGNEAQISIDSNSKPDYREKLEEELKALRESEMWQTAVTVRKLRPENN